jgi:uncharacterized protein with GYD domain
MADTVESIRAMIGDPRDRTAAVNSAIEQLGGRFHQAWVGLEDFDTVMIAELPDDVAANALWHVFKAADSVSQIRIQNIISINDHVDGLKRAVGVDYTPPQGPTWDRSAVGRIPDHISVEPRESGKGDLYLGDVADCNPASIRAMMLAPHDRTPAVASAIEQLGGRLHHAWITLGEFDAFMIVELPDTIAANALFNVFKAGEGVVKVRLRPVITLDDHMEALRRASQVVYTPPQGATWGTDTPNRTKE